MSRTVTRDLIGGDATLRGDDITIRRTFAVDGFDDGSPASRLINVVRLSSIPRVGDPHPQYRRARVLSVRATPDQNQPDSFRIDIEYSTAVATQSEADDEIEVEWTLGQVEETVFRDRNGDKIQTSYFSSGGGGGTLSVGVTTKTHSVAIEKGIFGVRLSRTMDRSARSFNTTFANTINDRAWSGFAAGSARCRGFTSNQEAPKRHRVTGEWVFSPTQSGLWRAEVLTDVDNVIPNDVRPGNGLSEWDVYALADHNRSGFRVPSE